MEPRPVKRSALLIFHAIRDGRIEAHHTSFSPGREDELNSEQLATLRENDRILLVTASQLTFVASTDATWQDYLDYQFMRNAKAICPACAPTRKGKDNEK